VAVAMRRRRWPAQRFSRSRVDWRSCSNSSPELRILLSDGERARINEHLAVATAPGLVAGVWKLLAKRPEFVVRLDEGLKAPRNYFRKLCQQEEMLNDRNKVVPGPGLEPGYSASKADVLPIRRSRNCTEKFSREVSIRPITPLTAYSANWCSEERCKSLPCQEACAGSHARSQRFC
jgi:hypothetical protein